MQAFRAAPSPDPSNFSWLLELPSLISSPMWVRAECNAWENKNSLLPRAEGGYWVFVNCLVANTVISGAAKIRVVWWSWWDGILATSAQCHWVHVCPRAGTGVTLTPTLPQHWEGSSGRDTSGSDGDMEREGLAPCWLSRVTVVLRRKRENLSQLNFFFFFSYFVPLLSIC